MSNHPLAPREGGALQLAAETAGWHAEQLELLKATVLPERARSDADLLMLAHVAKRTGLDPLARQLYALPKRGGGLVVAATIDGLRLVAQRTGQYEGRLGPEWCGADGVWRDVWLGEPGTLVAARVGVLRTGFRAPVWATALLREFRQNTPNWGDQGGLQSHMLAKVAEALALRAAFPQELSGVYSDDELDGRTGEVRTAPTVTPASDDPHDVHMAELVSEFGKDVVRTVWEAVGQPSIRKAERRDLLRQRVREHLGMKDGEQVDTGTGEVVDEPAAAEPDEVVVEADEVEQDDLLDDLSRELYGDQPSGRGGHRDPQA